jgi:hypothetical protein
MLAGDSGVAETAAVSVSADGLAFTFLGYAYGTTQFDIAGIGLPEVRYVKIEDDGAGTDDDPSGGHAGYDLNAVCAIHYISAIPRATHNGVNSDFNRDGSVSALDIAYFSGAYGTTSGQANYNADCDLNRDGRVNAVDISPFSGDYGKRFEDHSNADIDGDGCVTAADLAILTAAYGTTTTDAAYDAGADLNDDGTVDAADVATLSSQMGTCPGK